MNPFKIWSDQIFTWLLCCKHNQLLIRCVPRDIQICIAKLVPVEKFDMTKIKSPLLAENICYTEGQGLVDTWKCLLFGNGYNVYKFTVEYQGQRYTLIIHEQDLYIWQTHSKWEYDDSSEPDFDFDAVGTINGFWYNISHCKTDDYVDKFTIGHDDYHFSILALDIENPKPEIPLITTIKHDRILTDLNRDKRSDCRPFQFNHARNMIGKFHLDEKLCLRPTDLKQGEKYLLMINNQIIPFELNAQIREIEYGRW